MKKIMFYLFLSWLVVTSTSFAQVKVTQTYPTPGTSTPVAANGMGNIGISFTDENNFFFNPANLGLLAFDNKIYTSGYLGMADLDRYKIYNGHISFPLQFGYKSRLGIAYSYTKIDIILGPTTSGDYYTVNDYIHRVTAGWGYNNKYQLAFGCNVTVLKSDNSRVDGNTSFDIGFRGGYEFRSRRDENSEIIFNPSIGIAFNNFTLTNSENDNSGDDIKLPEDKRFGLSTRITYFKIKTQLELISVLSAFELEYPDDSEKGYYKYGVEMTLAECFALRVGDNERTILNYLGFSLYLNGFRKIGWLGKSDGSFVDRLNIIFNYARNGFDKEELNIPPYYEPADVSHYDYYEIILSLDI